MFYGVHCPSRLESSFAIEMFLHEKQLGCLLLALGAVFLLYYVCWIWDWAIIAKAEQYHYCSSAVNIMNTLLFAIKQITSKYRLFRTNRNFYSFIECVFIQLKGSMKMSVRRIEFSSSSQHYADGSFSIIRSYSAPYPRELVECWWCSLVFHHPAEQHGSWSSSGISTLLAFFYYLFS